MKTKIKREVLEMAAKAVGYEITVWSDTGNLCDVKGRGNWTPHIPGADTWDLAAKLKLIVDFREWRIYDGGYDGEYWGFTPNDPISAAEAVVGTAAYIGRTMVDRIMTTKLTITLANARIAELEERSMVQRVIERTIREHRDELRRKLSKFQESEFHPDWSMLEAARASLREHMHLLKESQAANEKLQANVARLEIYESIALNKERQQKEK